MDRLLQALEEVIHHLGHNYAMVSVDDARQIAALLRSGAEMRSSFRLRLEDGEPEAHKIDYVELGEAGQAWDTALGED